MKAKSHMIAESWDPSGGEISCVSMAFTDALRGGTIPKSAPVVQYPRLHSFAKSNSISVQSLMLEQDLDDIFFLPLSTQAHDEFLLLQSYLEDIEYDENTADSWSPVWGAKYTSRRFYAHVFSSVEAHPFYKALRKSSCIPRIKFFAWLILVDRLNTKTML
jgi:hypothetical protein